MFKKADKLANEKQAKTYPAIRQNKVPNSYRQILHIYILQSYKVQTVLLTIIFPQVA